MPGLAERKLMIAYAQNELHRGALSEVAAGLDFVCAMSEESSHVARLVLGAFVPVVVDPAHHERTTSLRTTAIASDLLAAGRFLRCSTPEGHGFDLERFDSPAGILLRTNGKPFTLGERRAMARRPTRSSLEKLLQDPHPMVTQILLTNPRITEDDVVRMAALRPAKAELMVEIAKAWSHRPRVRYTLVFNPGSQTALTVPLLSLMGRPDLQQAARAADLPAVVRATAHDLWSLRPPMPHADEPVVKH